MSQSLGASAPAVFNFQSSEVRTVTRDGEPWFVLADVAEILGFSRSRDAARVLDDDEKGAHIVRTPGGDQEVTIISESGVYALALRSRRPEAKPFRKWVTSEVLPAIRKTGRYEAANAAPPVPSFLNRRWLTTFDYEGRERVSALDPEHFLTKLAELPGLLRDPGFDVDGPQLAEIIHACADRMASEIAVRVRRVA
jgi:prophage antirepressor-like protein